METDKKITFRRVIMTPEYALELLNTNSVEQRDLRKSSVREYTKLMKNGLWKENGDVIRLDTTGKLIDGQHRLNAVIKANVSTIPFWIAENVPADVFRTIDTGRNRTMGDFFTIDKIPNAAKITAAIKTYLVYKNGRNTARGSESQELGINFDRVLTEYHQRPDYWQDLYQECYQLNEFSNKHIEGVTFIMSFRALFDDENPEKSKLFWKSICMGGELLVSTDHILFKMKDIFDTNFFNKQIQKNLLIQKQRAVVVYSRDVLVRFVKKCWELFKEENYYGKLKLEIKHTTYRKQTVTREVEVQVEIPSYYSPDLSFYNKVLFALNEISSGGVKEIIVRLRQLEPTISDISIANTDQIVSNLYVNGKIQRVDKEGKRYIYSI